MQFIIENNALSNKRRTNGLANTKKLFKKGKPKPTAVHRLSALTAPSKDKLYPELYPSFLNPATTGPRSSSAAKPKKASCITAIVYNATNLLAKNPISQKRRAKEPITIEEI